jgi:hypothetical protein
MALQAEGESAQCGEALLCARIGELLQPAHRCRWLLWLLRARLLVVLLLRPLLLLLQLVLLR